MISCRPLAAVRRADERAFPRRCGLIATVDRSGISAVAGVGDSGFAPSLEAGGEFPRHRDHPDTLGQEGQDRLGARRSRRRTTVDLLTSTPIETVEIAFQARPKLLKDQFNIGYWC